MDLLRETQQQVHLGDGISMSRWQVMIFCQELEADVFSYSTVLGIETRLSPKLTLGCSISNCKESNLVELRLIKS